MLETVWCAVNRITHEGRQLGKVNGFPLLSSTKSRHRQCCLCHIFEEQEKGTLTPERELILVLDQNPG